MMGSGLSRRRFLELVGASAAVAACAPATGPAATGAPAAATATAAGTPKPPIKVGGMWITSGSLSTYGEFARQGLELAVEELNAQGGILGRKIEFKIENEGTADNAVRVARRFAIDEGVDFLIGLDSSGVAEAVAPTMKELKKVFMITHAATPRVTGDLCNKYVFRMSVNVPQNSAAGARIAATEIKAKRWTNIGPDYAFGRQSWDYFKAELKKLQSDVVFLDDQAQWPKLGNEEFSSFIANLQRTDADAVWSSTWGNDLVNLVRQGTQFGLFKGGKPYLFELGAAMEVLETLGDQMLNGLWVGTRYWWQVPDTDLNRKFVDAFSKKYAGRRPSYNAQNAYTGMKLLAAAAERAKSIDTDAMIATLEDFEYDAPMGRIKIRKGDHQALAQGVWGKTAPSKDFKFRILDPIRTFKPEEITPTVAETGCKL